MMLRGVRVSAGMRARMRPSSVPTATQRCACSVRALSSQSKWLEVGAGGGIASTTRAVAFARRALAATHAGAVRMMSTAFEPGEPLRMPALSPTMESGQIAEWLVEEGQEVVAGDGICEIQTDKATLPFETQEDGIVARILVDAGSDVPVGQVIGVLVSDADDVDAVKGLSFSPEDLLPPGASAAPAAAASEAPAAVADTPAAASAGGSGSSGNGGAGQGPTGGFITPAARHMIARHGLDGSKIPASGPGGRVLKADVLAFLEKLPPQVPAPPRGAKAPGHGAAKSQAGAAPTSTATQAAAPSSSSSGTAQAFTREGGTYTDTKPSTMRAVIAQRLTESKATVPHFYVTMDCYIDDLMAVRKQLKAAGVKLSVNDMIIKCVAGMRPWACACEPA